MYILALIAVFILISFVIIIVFIGMTDMPAESIVLGALLGAAITILLAYYDYI